MAEVVIETTVEEVLIQAGNTVVVEPVQTTVNVDSESNSVVVNLTDSTVVVAPISNTILVEPITTTITISTSGGGGGGGSDSNVVLLSNGWPSSITLGQVVYSSADGIVNLAEANGEPQFNAIGLVAQSVINNGFSGAIQTSGTLTGLSGLTYGQVYYLSDSSAGVMVTSPPSSTGSYVVEVGVGLSTTSILIRPRLVVAL